MTQNLDYDLPTGNGNVTIATTNTDLTTDQANLTITVYNNTTGVGEWGTDNAALKYYNPGLWIYTRPTETNSCNGATKLSDCANHGWKEYQPGNDEHYLVGNYYSWAAATANTTITNNNATGSICPSGWKLPLGSNDDKDRTFYRLFKAYNIDTSNDNISGRIVAQSPFYFLQSGNITVNKFWNVGSASHYWSSTISSGSDAYYSFSNGSLVSLPRSGPRYQGYSIRCVASRES